MTKPNRREFLRSAAAVPVAATLRGGGHLAGPTTVPLDDALLLALAEAVLPAALAADGIRAVVNDFQRWLGGYAPGAERNHGYGTGRVASLPADPTPRWERQLAALAREAGGGWSQLGVAERRAVVRTHLAGDTTRELGSAIEAEHVAVALLARFYASPTGVNLGYRAAVNPRICRPLDRSPGRPPTLPTGPDR